MNLKKDLEIFTISKNAFVSGIFTLRKNAFFWIFFQKAGVSVQALSDLS